MPAEGAEGEVPDDVPSIPLGSAAIRRSGRDLTIVSLAVGVHRTLGAAQRLEDQAVSCEVIDLRSVRPLDARTLIESVRRTGRLLVVDEDYREFGLSGEVAAIVLEAGVTPCFGRVCPEGTLPMTGAARPRLCPTSTASSPRRAAFTPLLAIRSNGRG